LLENDNSATFVGFGLTSEDSNNNFRSFGITGKIRAGIQDIQNESFLKKQDGKDKAKSQRQVYKIHKVVPSESRALFFPGSP
jgi:hypothetical protein